MPIFYISKVALPNPVKRNGKLCYYDLIRRKDVAATPEEEVRQKLIRFLVTQLKVPASMIQVEAPLRFYGEENLENRHRADIVIEYTHPNGIIMPICVIECKEPNHVLCEMDVDQVQRYSEELLCDYFWLTNGYDSVCYKISEKGDQYELLESIPIYEEMLEGRSVLKQEESPPPRIPFDQLQEHIQDNIDISIGETTPAFLAVPALNLAECFLDVSHTIEPGVYDNITLVQDMGIRMLNVGNASGGVFSGPYRSFSVQQGALSAYISFSISSYGSYSNPEASYTALNVAVETGGPPHHALQLVLDRNVRMVGRDCAFWHSGKIAVGKYGSGKISELLELMNSRAPYLLQKGQIYLGTLTCDRLWYIDDPEVLNLMIHLMTYSLIRDEYREMRKRAIENNRL